MRNRQQAAVVSRSNPIGGVDAGGEHVAAGLLLPAVGQIHAPEEEFEPPGHARVVVVEPGKRGLGGGPGFEHCRPPMAQLRLHNLGQEGLKPAIPQGLSLVVGGGIGMIRLGQAEAGCCARLPQVVERCGERIDSSMRCESLTAGAAFDAGGAHAP